MTFAYAAGLAALLASLAATPHRATMTTRATGTFDVKMSPMAAYDTAKDATIAHMSVDKTFHGDLEATSKGEMLAAGSGAKNSSGAYVAIERVTGTLNGRRGSFALHHTGVMNKGTPQLRVEVVPDSGTDELLGLVGTMNIIIEGKVHRYEFDYSLPGAQR